MVVSSFSLINPFASRISSALYSLVPSFGIATTASAGSSSTDAYFSEYAVIGSTWISPAFTRSQPFTAFWSARYGQCWKKLKSISPATSFSFVVASAAVATSSTLIPFSSRSGAAYSMISECGVRSVIPFSTTSPSASAACVSVSSAACTAVGMLSSAPHPANNAPESATIPDMVAAAPALKIDNLFIVLPPF